MAKRAATPKTPLRSPAPAPEVPNARPRPSVGEPFAPADVIGNLDCVMRVGGPENDTAMVLLPGEQGASARGAGSLAEGSRFAVLGKDGHLFGDVLPFTPNHMRLGRRADSGVVAGFGDLRANSKRFRAPDTPAPVRIYVDGQVVYSTGKAEDFRIVADGSSFFVHESLPGGMSRLVVRDLDSGALEHIEMGGALKPRNEYEGAYGVWYTRDFREVQVAPLHLDRAFGTYRFYRVGGGEGGAVREVRLGESAGGNFEQPAAASVRMPEAHSAWFASSDVAFFADRLAVGNLTAGEPWRISRVELDYEEGVAKARWHRDIRFRGFNGRMTLSPNGAWLSLGAWTLRVLDTATGRTVFEFPVTDRAAARKRLRSVLSPDAAPEESGGFRGERFLGDHLLISRHIGSALFCGPSGSREHRECVAELHRRGAYRRVFDIFDMNTIALDSQPDFRLDVRADTPCVTGDHPLRGLQVHDGKLTFLTTRR